VTAKIADAQSESVFADLAAWLRGTTFSWRVALPVAIVLAIASVVIFDPKHSTTVATIPVASASRSGNDLAPTIANYQMAASQSPEKLSELLTQQGSKPLPPSPTYSISSFDLVNNSN